MTELTKHERVYPRKALRCSAALSMKNKPSIEIRTFDISLGGISWMLSEPIDPNQYCVVKFDASINGNSRPFSAIAKSIYNVRSSADQYRIGFQFLELSAANAAIIAQL